MPTTYAIPNGRTVFDATTYTGTGSSYAVTNATGFKPDFVWIKERSQSQDHALFDSVRGATKQLSSNTTGAEATYANSMSAFNTNGFSVVSDAVVNSSGQTYVGWQWQAGQGTTSTNNVGSISSTTSVNATAGFSIVTYTGNGVTSTVGHGLGAAPQFIIIKDRSAVSNWVVQHNSLGWTQGFLGISTVAATTSSAFSNNTAPTSTVFTIAAYSTNSSENYVAYCWTPIAGFSAFGSYTGNGSTDGPFIYTGFRPRYVMIKATSSVSYGYWMIHDTARGTYNVVNQNLYANYSYAEDTDAAGNMDILSNGFKLRGTVDNANGNGSSYIYMAFAENPFKYANAR